MKPTLVPLLLSSALLFSCNSPTMSPSSGDLAMSGVGGSGGQGGSGGGGGSGGSAGSGGSGGSGGASQDLAMSSPGGDMAMACSGSADCPNATPVCCSRIALNGGTIPNCNTTSVKYDCEAAAACPTMLNASCTGSQVVRVCKANSDCTEMTYNQCCAFTQGGSTIHFCANSTLAALGGGHCM